MIKCIGCLIYDKEKKMFLLQQRAKHCSHSLKWGFWGGKLHKHESFGDALKREIEEELGNVPDYVKLYPLDVFLSKDNNFIYYSFVMVVENYNDFRIQEIETNDSIWLPLEYIEKLNLHPGFKKTITEKKDVLINIINEYD